MKSDVRANRISYITWLQFLGFVFVVFGHSMNDVAVPLVFKEAKAWVYTFHMPLFFFVSAYLFSYKGGFTRGYKQVFSKRAVRLLVPYLIWNLLFIMPKFFLVPDARDHVVFSWSYFTHMLLYPRDAILGHTWFLFALFEMFVIAILFEKLRTKKAFWIPVLALLVVINCFGVTDRFLAVGDLMKNGVFFWVGLIAGGIGSEKLLRFCRNRQLMGVVIMLVVMMIVRLIFYFKLGLPPVIAMILMFFGGIIIPAIAVVILKKINIPGIKHVIKLVFGM